MLVGRFLSAKELIIKPSIWGFIGGALLFYTFSQQQMLIGRLPSALAICFTWIALSGWLKRTEKGLILCRAISGLGAISYELFLFHQPLIREYNHWSWNYFYGVQNPTKSQLLLGAAIAIGGLLLIILLTKKVIGLIRTPPGLDPSTIQSPISSP
jgi:peptidoglycan/LPS O-acetylase OafA/YrhL